MVVAPPAGVPTDDGRPTFNVQTFKSQKGFLWPDKSMDTRLKEIEAELDTKIGAGREFHKLSTAYGA